MDFKKLTYFSQLAKTKNFTKAAEQLGIAQSALSISIKKLEDQLGLKLVNRTERTIDLTAEGKVLLRHTKRILEYIEQVEIELLELKGLTNGVINFGASAMLASYFLPDALEQFQKTYPGIQIIIHDAGTATLEKMLINGELDLALIRCDREHEQIRCTLLVEEHISACVPNQHPFASRNTITLSEFCQQPLVLFKNGYFLREVVNSYCKKNKVEPNIPFETNLPELLKTMIKKEVGLGTCLPILVKNEPNLTAVPFDPPVPLKLGIGWKSSHYLSSASKAFIRSLQIALDKA